MPGYRIAFVVETPLTSDQNLTFHYLGREITFEFTDRISDREVVLRVQNEEAPTWVEAADAVMDTVIGPVLDVVALHRRTSLMLMQVRQVLKDQSGRVTREAILIQRGTQPIFPRIDARDTGEVEIALRDYKDPRPTLRWLRYSYRPITIVDRFLNNWMAYENMAGTISREVSCECGRKRKVPSLNRDLAFDIVRSADAAVTRERFDKDSEVWWREVRSAVMHGGREPDAKLRAKMMDIPRRTERGMVARLDEEFHFKRLSPEREPTGFSLDAIRHTFVRFETADAGAPFAGDTPTHEDVDSVVAGRQPNKSCEILRWDDTRTW